MNNTVAWTSCGVIYSENDIIRLLLDTVRNIAAGMHKQNSKMELDDLTQGGLIGLLEAIRMRDMRYKYGRWYQLAVKVVKRRMIDEMRLSGGNSNKRARRTEQNTHTSDWHADIPDNRGNDIKEIRDIWDSLSEKDRILLSHTLVEIGIQNGYSHATAGKRRKELLERIKKDL